MNINPLNVISFHGQLLADSQGEQPDALRRLLAAWQQGTTFRAINQAPWIETTEDEQHIECTTCGSSGLPKVIRRHRLSWQRTFEINRQLFSLTVADHSAVFGGLNHSLSLYGVCESLGLGMPVEVMVGMRPRNQVRLLADAGVTVLYITPTQLRLLTSSGDILPKVRLILCGGGKLDSKTRQRAAECFPDAAIHEFYGASETSFITLADQQTPEGSVGKAYPGVTIEIRHACQGIGEVWVSSPYLFRGYALGGSSETRSDGDFMTVGELGWLDEQGYLWLAGRSSRMVTIADQNVFPEAVETVISQRLEQGAVAVIACPDTQRGHLLHAFIQGESDPQLEKQLRSDITRQLGSAMVPRHFHFLAEFPLLNGGKADLQRLTALLNP